MKVYCKCTQLRTIPGILEQRFNPMEQGDEENVWVCRRCGHKVKVIQ